MTTEPLVLAVDDESGVRLLLKLDLTAQGFRVITAATPSEALAEIESKRPDLILLDVLMPEMTGFELLREVRERWHTPVIFLTAKDRDSDKVRGLETGADDYVVKPFSSEELVARINSVLRRPQPLKPTVEQFGSLSVDTAMHRVRAGDEDIALTPKDYSLFESLLRR
ncbi:MAG: response regulator transcription factor, partial [Tepidiformaceae bacterium]